MTIDPTMELARRIRIHSLEMVHKVNASHIGSCLSIADLLAVLYEKILLFKSDDPKFVERDRFILSKGHAAAALYAVLSEKGFFPVHLLDEYCQNGSILAGHASHYVPGVELSTGSLGHGLPVACGIALSGKRQKSSYRSFVLMSDGELDEGSNWETILFAPQHKLDNLVVIVDYNKFQGFGAVKDVIDLDPMVDKWCAFNWAVREIDGHDCNEIEKALKAIPFEKNKPSVIIANTVKGKGVSYMENTLAWHYKSPDSEQLKQALEELRA